MIERDPRKHPRHADILWLPDPAGGKWGQMVWVDYHGVPPFSPGIWVRRAYPWNDLRRMTLAEWRAMTSNALGWRCLGMHDWKKTKLEVYGLRYDKDPGFVSETNQ